jgi:hypothetical protein
MYGSGKIALGGLKIRKYALKKPIAITRKGEFIMTPDIMSRPGIARRSLRRLDIGLQAKLAIERNRIEPDYKLGIIGKGAIMKKDIMNHIQKRTVFGRTIISTEMDYCNELMSVLLARRRFRWPVMPRSRPASMPREWRWIPKKWWRRWRRYFRNIVLFCENTTDQVTKYAAAYRLKHVHPVFKSRGFIVIPLYGKDDIRARFAPIARNRRVLYISGVGHGSPSIYTGHNGNTILKIGSYDPVEVDDKGIHLLSCKTAQRLGPDMVRKRGRAYAGYYENYVFVFDQADTPVDEMELFWKCDSIWDLMMANGKTAEQAHRALISAYDSAIASVPNTAAATWLMHDRNCFKSPVTGRRYGDRKASIYPYLKTRHAPFEEVAKELQRIGITKV